MVMDATRGHEGFLKIILCIQCPKQRIRKAIYSWGKCIREEIQVAILEYGPRDIEMQSLKATAGVPVTSTP